MAAIASAFRFWTNSVVEDDERFLAPRSALVLGTLYWAYVTLGDIVYHEAMRVEIAEVTQIQVFFPWQHRVLQHLLMLPLLLACYSTALRIGWRPARRRVPEQIALALAFSLLMFWVMLLVDRFMRFAFGWPPLPFGMLTRSDWAVWVSSTVTGLLAYGCGLALLTVIATWRRYHALQLRSSELRRDWAGARLAALRAQLSPHTLFNVLNTIQARISGEPEVAESLMASLGDLLRGLLQAGEHDYALLRDELKFVELYLGLQLGRFADRLTVRVQSGEVPAVWVPSLIVQPLVENAVVHGLADHSGPVRIEVSWDLSPYRLQLQVVNSFGPGGSTPGAGGFGLRNVRERLQVQFGGRAVLSSSAVDASTWVATLHLPVLREWHPGAEAGPEAGVA
ncbi:MAG: histidine kinase [Gammaproteobacteria bacterium]|nr:histidine kinase [Gammaproteobacteria bacterium]